MADLEVGKKKLEEENDEKKLEEPAPEKVESPKAQSPKAQSPKAQSPKTQPVANNNPPAEAGAVNQRNLFKRLQSIREYNKFKLELKHQATLKKQDTLNIYTRQSSSSRTARIAPEDKFQMQSLVRSSTNRKRMVAWLIELVTF